MKVWCFSFEVKIIVLLCLLIRKVYYVLLLNYLIREKRCIVKSEEIYIPNVRKLKKYRGKSYNISMIQEKWQIVFV